MTLSYYPVTGDNQGTINTFLTTKFLSCVIFFQFSLSFFPRILSMVNLFPRELASSSSTLSTDWGGIGAYLSILSVVKIILWGISMSIGNCIIACNRLATEHTFPLCDAFHLLLTTITPTGATDFVRYPAAGIYYQSNHLLYTLVV